ncbi:hypothetical protein ACS0TY_033873 [Phlomoides rotata]
MRLFFSNLRYLQSYLASTSLKKHMGAHGSNRLAGAYQYEGDPLYDSLQILFNDPGVEGEFYPAFDVNELDQDYDEEVPFDMDAELDALQNATPSDFGSNG